MTLTTKRKAAAVIASTALLWGLAVSPALAEGAWSSSLTNAGKGFSSRWWTDQNRDSNSTRVRFSSCLGGSDANYLVKKVQLRLWRDNGLFPDHNHGAVTSSCNNLYASWGRMSAVGSYKWTVGTMYVDYLGSGDYAWISGGRVTVPSVRTEY